MPELSSLLEQAALNERILRRYQAFELDLLAADGLSGVLEMLLERAPQHFKLDAVELWLLDQRQTLQTLVPEDMSQPLGLRWLETLQPLQALYGSPPAVQLRSLDFPPDPTLGKGRPVDELFPGRRIRSAAALPLQRQGQLIGSLHFGSFSGQRFTRDKSSDFITHLASMVALCLENAVNQERLRHLSLIDVLTGIQNRRGFEQAMVLELARAGRTRKPLALLFADIDHFKRINDDHGHLTGDRVLVAVAKQMAAMLRQTDHVCRYGGEEFALLLPDCDRALAMEVAERVRAQVADLRVASDSGIPVSASLSIGVSWWPAGDGVQPADLGEKLIAAADRAVYAAKTAGRDRVGYTPYGFRDLP